MAVCLQAPVKLQIPSMSFQAHMIHKVNYWELCHMVQSFKTCMFLQTKPCNMDALHVFVTRQQRKSLRTTRFVVDPQY